MRPRLATVATTAFVVATVAVLSGCTSSSNPAAVSTPPASGSVSPTVSGGTPIPRGKVAAMLETALTTLHTVHLAVSTELSGQTIKGNGDVALSAGSITRGDVTQQLPSGLGSIRVVVDGTRTYAMLPSALTSSTKPWVLLSASSSHIVVSQLASTLAPILAVASPSTLVAFVDKASAVSDLGTTQIGGVTATHYRVIVQTAKLPKVLPKALFAGVTHLPVDLYLDQTGRPVEMTGTFGIDGQQATPTVRLSGFNQQVNVTPPPASEVDSS